MKMDLRHNFPLTLSILLNILLFLSLHNIHKTAQIPAIQRKRPFSPKWQIEEELFDHISNNSVTNTSHAKILEESIPNKVANSQCHKIWSRSSSAFQQRIQQKCPANDDIFLVSLSIVQIQPWRTFQVKNLTFLGTLILHNEEKTDSPKKEGLIKHWKKRLSGKPVQRTKVPNSHISPLK